MSLRGLVSLVSSILLVGLGTAGPSFAAAVETPTRYIVVLEDGVAPAAVAADHGVQARHVFTTALNGYAATLSASALGRVLADARVAWVEPDQVFSIVHHRPGHDGGPGGGGDDSGGGDTTCPGTQQTPWGIARIDAAPGGTCSDAVTNVNVYVIDTGADAGHADLNVVAHVNFAGGPNKDCNGHGTHVAGTVAAKDNTQDVVGVVPGAPITGVKVLGCSGSGWLSDVIMGVEWVTANAVKPAVANMSLGGGVSDALDTAVKASADAGIFYAVAAGNDGRDACTSSPARVGPHPGVITTAATNSSDQEPSWSNYGDCVGLWAPGASILSTKSGGGTTTMSGTSMAAPHVGGVAARYLSSNTSASPGAVETALEADAVPTGTTSKDGRAIELVCAGTC